MATRELCQECGKRCRAQSGTCPSCRLGRDGSQAQRPTSPCSGCGGATTAKTGWCRSCLPTYMKQGPITWRHGLAAETPGRWVTVRGVQRWSPAHPEKAA